MNPYNTSAKYQSPPARRAERSEHAANLGLGAKLTDAQRAIIAKLKG